MSILTSQRSHSPWLMTLSYTKLLRTPNLCVCMSTWKTRVTTWNLHPFPTLTIFKQVFRRALGKKAGVGPVPLQPSGLITAYIMIRWWSSRPKRRNCRSYKNSDSLKRWAAKASWIGDLYSCLSIDRSLHCKIDTKRSCNTERQTEWSSGT